MTRHWLTKLVISTCLIAQTVSRKMLRHFKIKNHTHLQGMADFKIMLSSHKLPTELNAFRDGIKCQRYDNSKYRSLFYHSFLPHI